MNKQNCYLIIDRIDENQKYIAHYKIDELFRRHNLQLNETGLKEVGAWCGAHASDDNSLNLDMFHLTLQEAQMDISFLKESGISARIQYHDIEEDISDGDLVTVEINPTDIVSDLNNLKQYLRDIYTLEKELYCSEQAKQEITNTINELGKPKQITIKERKVGILDFLGLGILKGIGGVIVGALIGEFVLKNFVAGAIIGGIIGVVWGLFDAVTDKKSANRNNQARNNAFAEDRQRVDKELSLVPMYQENQKLYAKNISSCKEALNQLYNANIIFPKYRNLVAISQIYEYFMSGRCTELEGHEGAYNIFENEIRQNIIIYQLNEVLANLEEIKRTQYMIYEAIQESNKILSSIESNTSAIAYNTSVIAENTAICARYAQSGNRQN